MGKRSLIILGAIGMLALSSLMCTFSPQTDIISTEAAGEINETVGAFESTLMAMATSAPTIIIQGATDVAEALDGSITGNLSYPSEFIPALRVVAFRLENGQPTGEYQYVDTLRDASRYTITDIQPGEYWVVAYINDPELNAEPGLAGGYTQFVLCGETVSCTDHAPVAVRVLPGLVTDDIHLRDWYAPENTFPDNPTQ